MDKTSNAKGDESTAEVVLRRPKLVVASGRGGSGGGGDCVDGGGGSSKGGKKKVKWSESTELRERLKVYRRSQIDLDLDYHHLAIEEEREREGVRRWRSILKTKGAKDVEDEDTDQGEDSVPGAANEGNGNWPTASEDDASDVGVYDSDDGDPEIDDAMEVRLQGIKEYTTRYTIYPAYAAAIPEYDKWLSKSENTKDLSKEQLQNMKSQIALYKRLVDIYSSWIKEENADAESRFGEITDILQAASDLGSPPASISRIIREILMDEENVQKQVDVYNNMVQEMITALDHSTEV